ncbi:hypothetical protein BU23DRAFT_48604 [Bimuria novae-zelandiae CBS 107.79]|uniref:non-specific serine/threonine protein kinase n=1 Tax=Bimuria novae-zelandiae CBS 107.79 TaxID=1447943 RepID=A0A6A5VFZ7_9PLEO|nr:hypothetical protein BU23DRAFT_48604 [Bimuria novae-zelandiae CBS 107.79]
MPSFLAADSGESSRSRSRQRARTEVGEHRSVWDRFKIGSWLKREEEPASPTKEPAHADHDKENGRPHSSGEHATRHSGLLNRRSSKKVVPGLPRPLTFKRMNSEKRDKLLEVPMSPEQRRAASADRRASTGLNQPLSPPPVNAPSMSAPDVLSPHNSDPEEKLQSTIGGEPDSNIPAGSRQVDYGLEESIDYLPVGEPPPLSIAGDSFMERDSLRSTSDVDDLQLQEELEAKWILNLSMHFRDMSDREKFFITFAEEPNKWRRVTVSCDYRELEPESLEADLKSLHYQRDKSARIYEAIRDSLLDIQFYETVTNLKLQTADGRLHVHVTEDVNEIIPYPSLSALDHLDCKQFRESAICFDSHISGFVYKVSVDNRMYIKKEIPGPDAVEEFLYEINALCSLSDSRSVIKFEGVIVDEKSELIKGLLISYAEQGALVDLIYDYKNSEQMSWERREKWARQIVEGLSEIHEASFVQGDFTLSNIVIDSDNNAKIIDINRRGCPVGWEPPELARLIESGQRISIYIGVKSDLFQLGMVLWALAAQEDEPERQERPLARSLNRYSTVPDYFKDIIKACLSDNPRDRPSAKDILKTFPPKTSDQNPIAIDDSRHTISTHGRDKEYIDPATAVNLDDISTARRNSHPRSSFSHVNVPSTEYIGSSGSYILPNPTQARGRSPNAPRSDSRNRRSDYSPYAAPRSVMSLDDSELENELASLPASRETRWEQVYVDGDTKLVQRAGTEIDVQDFAVQEPKDVCITTPTAELENSFIASKHSDETTRSLATVADMPRFESQHSAQIAEIEQDRSQRRSIGNKASFSDRIHQLIDQSTPDHRAPHIPNTSVLTDLEHDIALDSSVPSSAAPSRIGTGFSEIFSRPTHQDSGFSEPIPNHGSYDIERVRKSLEETMARIQKSHQSEQRLDEPLWDEKEATIGNGVRGEQLVIKAETSTAPQTIPSSRHLVATHEAQGKALEEKNSNTTIRPPGIQIPNFHHTIPKTMDASPPLYTPHSNRRAAPEEPLATSYTSTSSTSRSISSFEMDSKF